MAPLKHHGGGRPSGVAEEFPRLQKRGPIEAMRLAPLATKKDRCFHAYKSVAPLKRHKMSEAKERLLTFPRLQKRGPIEAHSCQPASGLILGFHAYKSVAPLKRPQHDQQVGQGGKVSTLTKAWPH